MVADIRAAFAAAALLGLAGNAAAQQLIGPVPTTMYIPPPANGVWLPAAINMHPSYFYPPVSYYPVQNRWIGPSQATAYIVAPARVSFGPFGRTFVSTPYWKAGF